MQVLRFQIQQARGVEAAHLLTIRRAERRCLSNVFNGVVFAHVERVVGAKEDMVRAKLPGQELELVDFENDAVEVEFLQVGRRRS